MRNQRGDTLIEVIVSLAIMSIILITSLALSVRAFQQGLAAKERTQAANMMQQQAEALRNLRDNSTNWDDFKAKLGAAAVAGNDFYIENNSGWKVNNTDLNSGPFTLKVTGTVLDTFSDVRLQSYKATIKVSWEQLGGGPTNTSTLTTTLGNTQVGLPGNGPPPACNDHTDNDGDHLIDFPDDPGCISETDNSEFNPPPNNPPHASLTASVLGLSGKVKFNGAGSTDDKGIITWILDFGDGSSQNGTGKPSNNIQHSYGNTGKPYTATLTVTDGDGLSNSTSVTFTMPSIQCSDGVDNDGDGKTDLKDPGCSSASDTTESPDPAQCNDKIDNDGDGKTDLKDPGCSSASDNSESDTPSVTLEVCRLPIAGPLDGGVVPPQSCVKATDGSNSINMYSHSHDQLFLNWSSSNSEGGCSASGDWGGNKSGTGGENHTGDNGGGQLTYSLSCSNSAGDSGSSTINVNVTRCEPRHVDPWPTAQYGWYAFDFGGGVAYFQCPAP